MLGEFSEHAVRVDPGVADRRGRGPVMSHHHQGIGRIGDRPPRGRLGRGRHGRGLEDPEKPFVVGVLWHPEAGEDQRLFEQLVEAARA